MQLKPLDDIANMDDLRANIDALDHALIDLLATRQAHVDRAAVIKQREGLPADIPARVQDVLDHIHARAATAGFDPQLATQMWALMIEAMIAREEKTLVPIEGTMT